MVEWWGARWWWWVCGAVGCSGRRVCAVGECLARGAGGPAQPPTPPHAPPAAPAAHPTSRPGHTRARRYRALRAGEGPQPEEVERLLLAAVDYPLNLQLNGARRPLRLPGGRALHEWPVVVPELAAGGAPGVATRAGSLRQAWQKVLAG
jgi:hypothetical protein